MRVLLAVWFVLAAPLCHGQFGAGSSGPPTAQAQPAPTIPNLSNAQIQGSVPTTGPLAPSFELTLDMAIDRGLRTNLGVLVRDSSNSTARAASLRALSALLPTVTGSVSENVQQTNLQALGIKIPFAPKIVGPFGYTDVRASASAVIWDTTARRNVRTALEGETASVLSRRDAEDLVTQAISNAFFLVISDEAQVRSVTAQIEVAKALYEQALDQKRAGTGTGLDATRAEVQLKSQQQLLIAQVGQLNKDKLALARIIGLPLGQTFNVKAKPASVVGVIPGLDALLPLALTSRADVKSLQALMRSAESAVEAARAQRYPSLSVNGNYGAIGPNIGNSHGTFTFSGALKFNIFDAGRIRADVEQAEALLQQRRDEFADLRSQVEYQVRTALVDLKTTQEQVDVARANTDLANQSLAQSRQRFEAGVTTTVEVVQAQQQIAAAEQSLISAIYLQNVAKASLARAMGSTRANLNTLLEGAELRGER